MGYTKNEAQSRQRNKKPGVEYSHGRGSHKNYVVNVPDYDNNRPDRIISLVKMTNAKEAQDYYEAWTKEHRRQYELRLNGGDAEAEEAKAHAEAEVRRRKADSEVRARYKEAQRRIAERDRRIESLNAIADRAGEAYGKEKERSERLQAELDAVRKELEEAKAGASAKGKGMDAEARELAAKRRKVRELEETVTRLDANLERERERARKSEESKDKDVSRLEEEKRSLQQDIFSSRTRIRRISILCCAFAAIVFIGCVLMAYHHARTTENVTYVIDEGVADTTSGIRETAPFSVDVEAAGGIADTASVSMTTDETDARVILSDMRAQLIEMFSKILVLAHVLMALILLISLSLYLLLFFRGRREEARARYSTIVVLALFGTIFPFVLKIVFL